MEHVKLAFFVILLVVTNSSMAVTLCISPCNIDYNSDIKVIGSIGSDETQNLEPISTLTINTNIFVDGNLYIDYSVFSTNADLNISGDVELIGQEVTIYSFYDKPLFPDNYSTMVSNGWFLSSILVNPLEGDWVLFSSTPISNGVFEATDNLYIGDYSSLYSPIPVPASFWLFSSGLLLIGRLVLKHRP